MTYQNAMRVQVGDKLRAKDGYMFTVERIEEKTDEANINRYFVFRGISDRGIAVYYNHKNIRSKL
jgi:hypothetical protein